MSLEGLALYGPDIACPNCSQLVKPLLLAAKLDAKLDSSNEGWYTLRCPACDHKWSVNENGYTY